MDGDMVDPPVDKPNVDPPVDKPNVDPPVDKPYVDAGASPSHAEVDDSARVAADAGLDDSPERASEIDDVTDSILRPDPDAPNTSEVDVVALLAERDEYKSMAQRIQAEFDNYRKRSAAQSLVEADRASGRLAEALLPVLDAAEAAYVRYPDEVGPLLNQMLTELKKHGLEILSLEQQPFDPEFAEAVAHEPGDGGDPVVAEVLRSGYLWKGRVLRAAMVRTKDGPA